MGQSLSAKLVYGLKVYDADGESWPYPLNKETYEPIWPSWVVLEEDGEPEDFGSQVEDRLIEVLAGFRHPEPEVDWNNRSYRTDPNFTAYENWRKHKNEAGKAAGIGTDAGEIGLYSCGATNYQDEYLGFLLFRGSGRAAEFDLDAVRDRYHSQRSYEGWQETISQAIAALNFQIEEPEPKLWLLANYS